MTALWGISFDGAPISGLIVEFVKTARLFHDRGIRVHLDLGYDIKADKNAFFRPYTDEAELLPEWIELDRIEAVQGIDGYTPELVTAVLREVIGRGDDSRLRSVMHSVTATLRDRILAKWTELGISFVLVENGTLPENVIYTRALYQAIEEYGNRHRLGCFVLWRDHDLMW